MTRRQYPAMAGWQLYVTANERINIATYLLSSHVFRK